MRDLVGIWWAFATTDPPRLIALVAAVAPSCASASPRLHGFAHNKPSPMATCSPSHPSHPTFCSLPSHSSHHPSKPYKIKQSLLKIAVNERAVTFFCKKDGQDTYDIANYCYICNVDWQHSAPTPPRAATRHRT